MTKVKPGNLFEVHWPFTDQAGAKRRPAVALGAEDSHYDVELLMVTTQKQHGDCVALAAGDYATLPLPKPSFVRIARPLKVRMDRITPLGLQLTLECVSRLRKGIILRDTRSFSSLAHRANRPADDPLRAPFIPGKITVPYAGRVFTEDEVEAAVSSTLDFWLTLGPEGEAFEKELAELLGVESSLLANSGSSANLVALSALTSHELPVGRRIQPGDEVITVAAGFPTTVAPIVQTGAVPVFIDNDPVTGNVREGQLEAAFAPGKTKAVMIAHTLGNPFDLGAVLAFCRQHDLWLIEDNCDALGSTYSLPVEKAQALGLDHLLKIAETGTHPLIKFDLSAFNTRLLTAPTGTWGNLSTQSFYPPHHLTMGEGGAVNIVSRPALKTCAESFRDWGRDCWCASGKDNTCKKRFGWKFSGLPEGYDHKYIYSYLGFNLKPLDLQAAIGRQQLKKLPAFGEARRHNWNYLRAGLAGLEEFINFTLPTHATGWTGKTESGKQPGEVASQRLHGPGKAEMAVSTLNSQLSTFSWDSTGCRTDCSWFGFMLRVKPGAPFTHSQLARHLEEKKIGNRMLFGGNLLRQPAFMQLKKDRPQALRVVGDLAGSDDLMSTALFLGTYPGLTKTMLDYELEVVRAFVRGK